MDFTKEQKDVLNAKGRIIVSASAGSGKTTVMIEKIIRLIQGGTRVDEILAVTFTKKAASQMKEKLGKALIKSIYAPETTAEKRAELKKQLLDVPNADVSTIHSFCAKLIRTHFYKAGVDNAFRVIDSSDAEGAALKNAALDELFEEGYENKDAEFSQLLSVYWRKKSDTTLRKILTETYETLRCRDDYKAYLKNSCAYDERTFDSVCKDVHGCFAEKCRYYLAVVEKEREYFSEIPEAKAQLALSTELKAWLEGLLAQPDLFACANVGKPKFTQNRKDKACSEETVARAERLGAWKDRIVKSVNREFDKLGTRQEELEKFLLAGETARALSVCLLRFDEKYTRLKFERGVLDYNDLEHKALDLLADEEVAAEIRHKYRYVFVDEYQDVNPVQEKIISRLSGENLFLVGDVKQAIYGFRGSKSRFFVEKQAEFEKDGQNLQLTSNFRSARAILSAVNAQFSLAMTKENCAVEYKADSIMQGGDMYGEDDGRVQLHFFGKESKEKPKDRGVYSVMAHADGEETEESLLARRIYEIVKEERSKQWFDVEKNAYRPIRYADIAVLSRKKKGEIAKTVAALSAAGIPVTAASAINVCDYAEVKTLMDILSLLDNAEQDIPLCSALLSAMGNLSADDLVAVRLAYPNAPTFRAACKKYATEQTDFLAHKLQKFYAYYEKTRVRARVLDAGELLTLLLSETHMEAALLTQENGPACLKRIHRFIEETAVPEPLSVHAFLERLRDMEYKIEYSESGGEDSLKVLTMHSSKGLEYPVVILDNLSAPFRAVEHDEVFVEEKYGLAPRAFNGKELIKSSTLLRRLYEWEEQESALADELNLYYVALTRAKYSLHMLFEKDSGISDVRYARSFAELTDFSVWKGYYADDDELIELQKQERDPLVFRPDETLTKEIMQEFTWKYPYAACTNLPVKSSATQLLPAEQPRTWETEFGKTDERSETLFDADEYGTGNTDIPSGLAYHAFLEHFEFSRLFDGDGKRVDKETLAQAVAETLKTFAVKFPTESSLVTAEKAQEILENPVFTELYGARLFKEQQFLVALPVQETYALKEGADVALKENADGEEMIFQGAIDLLAIGEHVRIIDYKYSSRGAKSLKTHYKAQLNLYKKAVAKILRMDEKEIRCTIVNIYRGFQVEMD